MAIDQEDDDDDEDDEDDNDDDGDDEEDEEYAAPAKPKRFPIVDMCPKPLPFRLTKLPLSAEYWAKAAMHATDRMNKEIQELEKEFKKYGIHIEEDEVLQLKIATAETEAAIFRLEQEERQLTDGLRAQEHSANTQAADLKTELERVQGDVTDAAQEFVEVVKAVSGKLDQPLYQGQETHQETHQVQRDIRTFQQLLDDIEAGNLRLADVCAYLKSQDVFQFQELCDEMERLNTEDAQDAADHEAELREIRADAGRTRQSLRGNVGA